MVYWKGLKHTQTVIGCDLGGTKCAVALYDTSTWEELKYVQTPTDASRGFDAVLQRVADQIASVRQEDTAAVGLGVPGLLRQPEGRLVVAPNIPGSRDAPIREALTALTGFSVLIENDARCFTLAEAVRGAGKGKRVVVGVTMGTGVGGGIVVDGRVMTGEHGFAGEIGHMLLRPGEPPYPTDDKRGDAEQFFSGTAMGKRCEAAQRPEEYLEGQACSFLHPLVFREIAWMIANLTYLLDPSVIVLGGSAGLALRPHLHEVRDELGTWLLSGTPMPEIAVATTTHPGTLGAALLTRDVMGSEGTVAA